MGKNDRRVPYKNIAPLESANYIGGILENEFYDILPAEFLYIDQRKLYSRLEIENHLNNFCDGLNAELVNERQWISYANNIAGGKINYYALSYQINLTTPVTTTRFGAIKKSYIFFIRNIINGYNAKDCYGLYRIGFHDANDALIKYFIGSLYCLRESPKNESPM